MSIDPKARASTEPAVDDAWLDDALAQSFPASDPLPVRHHDPAIGVEQPPTSVPVTSSNVVQADP
jgi:hypothetical protein